MQVISMLLSIIFIFLAGLHFYWALFGLKDPSSVLPTKENGQILKKPKKAITVLVGIVLAVFATVYLSYTLSFNNGTDLKYLSMGIGTLFLLRAVGDFKYLGFFKTQKGSKFAKMDSKYYSPLSISITLLIFILEFWS